MYNYFFYGYKLSTNICIPSMESNLPYINMEELFLDVKPLNALSPVSDQIAQTLCLGINLKYHIYKNENRIVAFSDNVENVASTIYNVPAAIFLLYRNLFLLHTSAVEINGKIFCFAGNKGVGKSTLTLYLSQYMNHYSDDALLIKMRGNVCVGIRQNNLMKIDITTYRRLTNRYDFNKYPKNIIGKAYLNPYSIGHKTSTLVMTEIKKIYIIKRTDKKEVNVRYLGNKYTKSLTICDNIVANNFMESDQIYNISKSKEFKFLLNSIPSYELSIPSDINIFKNERLAYTLNNIMEINSNE